ncbi:MAG: hypothetical protein IJI05_06125, partial [Erysipelotrichaceae bacterium]|nr:hypothetical protein [Erysipelotrichaceae bacterium]
MMKEAEIAGRKCLLMGDLDSHDILIQAGDDHDLSLLEKEYELIRQSVDRPFGLLALKITNWNKELSPWPAPAVFGTEDFGDGAAETLKFITGHLMDKEKSYYLGGYSLAGFFALWAASQCDLFAGVAGVSPSVWFPGWKEYFNEHPL